MEETLLGATRARHDLRRLYMVAFAVSAGGGIAQVALVLRLTYATGSGWVVAGLWLAGTVPAIALSPWTGLAIDRIETVLVLRAVTGLEALLDALLAIAPGVGWVLGLGCVLGVTASVGISGVYALLGAIPNQTSQSWRSSPLSVVQAATWAGATVGPLAGAGLATLWQTQVPLLVAALLTAACSLALGGLKSRRPPDAAALADGSSWSGFALLARDRSISFILAPVAMVIVAVNLGVVVDVFLATRVLGAGGLGYGALITAWGAGMIGGTLMGGRLTRWAHWKLIAAGGMLAGLGLALAGLSPVIGSAVAAYVLGGGGNGLEAAAARRLLQTRADSTSQGRAFAAYFAFGSTAAIAGTIAGGIMLQPLGPRHALELGGAMSLVAAMGLALLGGRQGMKAQLVGQRQQPFTRRTPPGLLRRVLGKFGPGGLGPPGQA
ncbi:MAG: MFS transporter [Candidatus Dormibacteria bacterium]|jgi:MFS family permease